MGRKEANWIADKHVLELNTMRSSYFNPKSKAIFGSITKDEVKMQVAELVEKVTPEVIEKVLAASMLPAREEQQVRSILLNRRETLKRVYLT